MNTHLKIVVFADESERKHVYLAFADTNEEALALVDASHRENTDNERYTWGPHVDDVPDLSNPVAGFLYDGDTVPKRVALVYHQDYD